MTPKAEAPRKLKPRTRIASAASTKETFPHSWSLETWPPSVWPNDPRKARYVLRMYAGELIAQGALTRIGRERIVLGAPYTRWLGKRRARFAECYVAPNEKPEGAAA